VDIILDKATSNFSFLPLALEGRENTAPCKIQGIARVAQGVGWTKRINLLLPSHY